MSLAYAHTGALPPADTGMLALLDDWTFDPTFLVPLVLAVLYLRGWRRYRREGSSLFPRWRLGLFLTGVVVLALALLSPIDYLADFSFAWHMVQHLLLMMVGVPLVLLGAPFLPVVRGLPGTFRQRAFVPFARNRVVRAVVLTLVNPVWAFALLQVNLVAWHVPALYDLAYSNDFYHYLEHFLFVLTAGLLWWNVVTPFPFAAPMHPMLRMVYVFLTSIPNSVLGGILTFSTEPIYAYRTFESFWGASMLADQRAGGLLMWVGGGMMYVLAVGIVFAIWARQAAADEPERALYIDAGTTPHQA